MANVTAWIFYPTSSELGYIITPRTPRVVLPPEGLFAPLVGQLWPRGDKNIYV